MHAIRRSGICAVGVLAAMGLLACTTGPWKAPDLAMEPLYQPPEALPVSVGLQVDNSLTSQLYGSAVIADLRQMQLFQGLVAPIDAYSQMDSKLRLFIERAETKEIDEFVLGLAPEGNILESFSKPDPILATSIPVPPDVAAGMKGTLEGSKPQTIKAVARRLANALGKKVYEERATLLPKLKKQ